MKMNKRGVFDQLTQLAIGICMFAVIGVTMTLIVANTGANIPSTSKGCINGYHLNGTVNCLLTANTSQPAIATSLVPDTYATAFVGQTQAQLATLPGWLGVIIVVAIGALLISMVMMFRSKKE